jgi:hypothetical protein
VLTPEEREENIRAIDRALVRSRQALRAARSRGLTTEQTAEAQRIETFIKQAELGRTRDPITARSLAERADVLARNLFNRVR